MMAMLRLPFIPGTVVWTYKQGDAKAKVAISDQNSAMIYLYDAKSGSGDAILSKQVLIFEA